MTKAIVNLDLPGPLVSRHQHGHFAEHLGHCIYEGIFVGADSEIPNDKGIRLDVVEALKEIGIPNLRWPGGCFADDYHWRDGIGTDRRPLRGAGCSAQFRNQASGHRWQVEQRYRHDGGEHQPGCCRSEVDGP